MYMKTKCLIVIQTRTDVNKTGGCKNLQQLSTAMKMSLQNRDVFCNNIIPCCSSYSYKMGKMSFLLTGTNGFHMSVEKERFSAVGLQCGKSLKFENFT